MKEAFAFRFFAQDNFYDEEKIESKIAEFESRHGVKEVKALRKEAVDPREICGTPCCHVVVVCVFS